MEKSEDKIEPLPTKSSKSKSKSSKCRGCFGFCAFLKTSWRTFKEFSADTSIHGIKYLTDKRLPWTEKLFWAIALILSGTAAGYLILNTFRQWQQTPVIVTLSENFMNVWEIPYPALTICPVGGASPLKQNVSADGSPQNVPLHFHYDIKIPRISNVTWMGEIQSAEDLFHQTVTEEGFCYTFNSMNYHDLFNDNVVYEAYESLKDVNKTPHTQWILQDGYLTREPRVYPRRATGSGEMSGLTFQITRELMELKLSERHEKGFRIAFHLPNEVPRMNKRFYRFPLEKSATIILHPSMVITEQLNSYDVQTRQCYLEGEKKLKYFRSYTRSNCQVECSANYTMRKCGCIHHSMPRMEYEKVCNWTQQECYRDGKLSTLVHTMEKSLNTSRSFLQHGKSACGCLPACTSLEYDGEISVDEMRYFSQTKVGRYFRSLVTIFFKHDDFIYSKRSELYSFTDFIANFGGILGLFLGVSLLSIVEVIYFIAFRDVKPEHDHTHGNNYHDEDN